MYDNPNSVTTTNILKYRRIVLEALQLLIKSYNRY